MTDKFFALYSCLLPVLRVNVSPLASEYIRLFSLLITRDVSQERRRETAVIQTISPFACDFHDGVTVLPFSRKHCTLTATLEMGKIYSNHLHFLSNLLKCPVDNTGNGISEPLNLKISGGACPQTVIPPALERLRTSNFFSFAYTFKISNYAPVIRISETCFSRQIKEATSQVSHYQPATWLRYKQGKS